MKTITEISKFTFEILKEKEGFLTLDIREKEEFLDYNMGGLNVPSHELKSVYESLEKQENIIVVCSNGLRSSIIARVLSSKLKNPKIFHLSEGIFND